jgi:nickel superoxide dismutase
MKRTLRLLVLVLALSWAGQSRVAWAHCEIPCGIYGDKMRIAMLYEHVTTVEKSMKQIYELAEDPSTNANQLVRWVSNKEAHCNAIQHIVTQYFMTQRIKPVPKSDESASKVYLSQLRLLHAMLIHAMKAKQTTDADHVEQLRQLIDEFAALYFTEDDLKHPCEHHR